MKKYILVMICAFFILTLCACQKSEAPEIKNRSIVQAVGIDNAEDGKLLVTFELINTDTSSDASAENPPKKPVNHLSVKADTVSQSIEEASLITGKKLFITQNRLIVFGEEFAKGGISRCLDEFLRNTENRFNVFCVCCEGRAEDFFENEFAENVMPSELCCTTLSQNCPNSVGVKLYQIVNCLEDEYRSFLVPLLKYDRELKSVKTDGAYIFSNDRASDILGEESVSAYNLITKRLQSGVLTFKAGEHTLSLQTEKTSGRIQYKRKKNELRITVKASFTLKELSTASFEKSTDFDIREIEAFLNGELQKRLENTIEECIIKKDSDIFGFGVRTGLDKNSLKHINYKITVKSKIVGTGDNHENLF